MNVAVDAFNLAADRRGMGRVAAFMLARLHDMGARLSLVARDRKQSAALSERYAYPVVLAKELRSNRPDVTWYPWNALRFDPCAPCVVTVHDLFAFTFPHRNAVARWREQSPIRRAIARASCVVAVSDWTKGEIERFFTVPPDRLTVVRNGLDPFWKAVDAPRRSPYFFFAGSPEERKNAAMLQRAFENAAVNGAELVVADGNLSDEELRAAYSGALAVLVPSLAEGYGLVAVEAMACGAPVLAADAAALPETCGGAALLLPPRDERAWSDAIARVLRDEPLRSRLRERSLRRAEIIAAENPAEALFSTLQRVARSA